MKRRLLLPAILTALMLFSFSLSAWGKTVTLSWDASPSSVTGYKIYYDINSSTSPLDGTGATEGNSPIDVGNVLTFTVNGLSDTADHYFAVTAYDGSGNESVYSNTVHSSPAASANNPPVLAAIGNKTVLEGATLNFTLSANDADGDALTYSATNLPSGAGFNPSTRVFSWTPVFNQSQVYTVTFSVSDGSDSDTETISITVTDVNRAPVLNPVGTKTIGEGSQLTFTVSGSDPDGDALTYSAESLPTGATFNPSTRLFNWIPAFDISENTRVYPVTFKVSDGLADDSETMTINVTNVNRAPVLVPIGPQVMTEGDSFNLVINASDPDNNALTYAANSLPEGAVFTASTRSFSWIPGNDQAGTYQVVFNVSDGSLIDSETVTLTVGNGNEAPILGAIGSQSVNEGSLLSFVINATDVNDDSLEFTATGLPSGAEFNTVQRRFSWTPDYAQAGSFSVVFSVTDGVLSDSETVSITVANTNRPPVISGTPVSSVMANTGYSFAPTASDPDGDSLTYSITNKPVWADFSVTTGELSGVPVDAQVGIYPGIVISVSDSGAMASLVTFSINVDAYIAQDSDGDGVLDYLDAFPNDSTEWLDTDGDHLGNNSDSDDDNDGVADIRDGFPLDGSKTGWIITAIAGSGGYINPEGETTVLYGGSQQFELTPMAGYYISNLLVDHVAVGLVQRHEFENVSEHHSIEAIFAPIPTGLSFDPIASGLSGIERVDGGDDSNNLVDGHPKQDLDYRFRVVLRDNVAANQRKVYLLLNGYKYQMQLDTGVLNTGADYTFVTRLGPAFLHRFYFVAEDLAHNQMWRYPHSGDLPGPVVELLNGRNVLGVAADINAYALDAEEALNDKIVYRWLADSGPNGSFKLADSGAPISSGEGYVLKKAAGGTLPDRSLYGEITDSDYEIQLKSGWNLISNPYGGNVALADVHVRRGSETAVPWLEAAENMLVVDLIYSYLGEDWGGINEFASAGGNNPAKLVPWIGYWIYVNPSEQAISLLVPKPLQ